MFYYTLSCFINSKENVQGDIGIHCIDPLEEIGDLCTNFMDFSKYDNMDTTYSKRITFRLRIQKVISN